MYPYLEIIGINFSVYSLCTLAGVSVTVLLVTVLLREKFLLRKYISIIPGALLGALLGARAFGILSKGLGNLYYAGTFDISDSFSNSGVVFLGGVIGVIFMAWIMCHTKNRRLTDITDILGIAIPVFHTFGRLGCYFAGCCYGREYVGFLAMPYRIGPDDIPTMRFPTQLFEAVFEMLLGITFLTVYCNRKSQGERSLLYYYLLSYSLFRFVLEFWRGDTIRGVFYGISFSQIVCLLILFWLFSLHKLHKKREERI